VVVGRTVVGGKVVVGPAVDEVDVLELVLGAFVDGIDVLAVVLLADVFGADVLGHEQVGRVATVESTFTLVAGG
jgi:hypothetical protein